ncbi:hypothetical protein HPP92_011217 [Vanilla planifolia]|uniref:Glycosyl transferase family 1 domain-containing protein n=1 Tax=Vanilla planifolia TaxID=51239 RepID=A0A835R3U4_VANPL|nr:hypothetical protein HPP92_011217 [Vanilla planifolia]
MGSLDTAVPWKRAQLLRSASDRPFLHRPRSRLARFLLFKKVDYLHWVCTAAVFFFVFILFQAFLPVSVPEKSPTRGSLKEYWRLATGSYGELEFGEGIRFLPTKLLEKFERERKEADSNFMAPGMTVMRAGIRKPRLALVVAGASPDAMLLQMVSIARVLKEIGYDIEVFSFHEGLVHDVWRNMGIQVNILPLNVKQGVTTDWLDYSGVLASSVEAQRVISCLLQEPFKSIPIIWTIQDQSLAVRLNQYVKNGQAGLLGVWTEVFSRANVIVFTSHYLPIIYSAFDSGNYFVIPSYAPEAWAADRFLALDKHSALRVNIGYKPEDFLIAIVGSQFDYSGMWLEHALVLQALAPLLHEFHSYNNYSYPMLKVGVLKKSSSTYSIALESIALNLGYPRGTVQQIGGNVDNNSFLVMADLIIYGSFLEEQSFPPVLVQAMSLGKLVIAPDLGIIEKHIHNGVNGFLYPKDELGQLTMVVRKAILEGGLSPPAQLIATSGQVEARNLMVSETVQSYSWLLENVLKFSSEISPPKAIADIPSEMKEKWQWHLFEYLSDMNNQTETVRGPEIVEILEEEWNRTHMVNNVSTTSRFDESYSSVNWEIQRLVEAANAKKRLEEDELRDRTDQPRGTWEEVYRSAKRADRTKSELHERDEKELERIGQPLCIYEPYLGEGTWPFLHNSSLYRGISLSSKGRRSVADDIDASSRLPLISDAYYRATLGEYGAFFALANRIDRIHKNAWTGFQSWRVGARKLSLSSKAEKSLIESIETRKHGDALYFWVRMDKDPRNPLQQDYWSFCDAINAGNCRFAVSEALGFMYGVPQDSNLLPPMPKEGGTWSVMHSWALPTRSFLELVMFSRYVSVEQKFSQG